MSGAEVPIRPAMSEREIDRFQARVRLFRLRGWDDGRADAAADDLVLRDRDGDDRRMCIECQHLQRDGACFAARQGWLRHASHRLEPIQDLLARCGRFVWAKPPVAGAPR